MTTVQHGHDESGTTAQRPSNADTGFKYFDTELNQLLVWNGTEWIPTSGRIRATWDFAVDGGAISAIDIDAQLPDNAIIVGGFVDVITTLTSATDAATVAIHAQTANDIVAAIAISNGGNPWDAGLKAIIPKANTPESTGIKLTAARDITVTIAVEAVTAGKFNLFLDYVLSE